MNELLVHAMFDNALSSGDSCNLQNDANTDMDLIISVSGWQ